VLRLNAACFVDVAAARRSLATLEGVFPAVVEAARAVLPTHELAGLMRSLVAARVSVRDLPRVLERAVELRVSGVPSSPLVVFHDHEDPATPAPDTEEWVRLALARQIQSGVASRGTTTVVAYLFDPPKGVEAGQATVDAVRREIEELPPGVSVPAIVTDLEARRATQAALASSFPHVAVVAHPELAGANVQPIARIKVSEDPAGPA
jgi:type III secretory pathway component EscV